MRVIWSETAIRDLQQVRAYIAERNPQAAPRVAQTLIQASRRLAAFPASGRPGRVPNTRELVIPGLPYVLPYTVDADSVVILAVMHGVRKWPTAFP